MPLAALLPLVLVTASSCAALESQKSVYLIRIDREEQRLCLISPHGKRMSFEIEGKDPQGKIIRESREWLPVCTKAVRFVSAEGPVIPNDPYGRYCEIPPAGRDSGGYYHVGPIQDVPSVSLDFGFYKIRLTGPPADMHGRSGLLIHGGGKKLPDPLADFQGWQCTHGCVRMQNAHLKALVQALRSLPDNSDVRLVVTGGKCRRNGVVAETYRWEGGEWRMVDG